MKKKSLFSILSVLLVLSLLLAACGGDSSSAGGDAGGDSGGAATTPSGGGGTIDVTMGTAGTSGVYYIVGAAMGKIINENSDLNVIVQATNGSVENINLVQAGEMDFGWSNSDGVYYAYEGIESFAEAGKQDILGLMSLYLSCGQMATRADSGIDTYADLVGKRVCLGPPSTTIIDMSRAILMEYGIDPDNDITPYYLSIEEGCSKLADGDIDATFFVAATPTAGLMNIATTGNIKMVDADVEVLERVIAQCPYYSLHVIEGGTYTGIDDDVNTLKLMTNIFVHKDVDEEICYEFVKAAMENIDQIMDTHVVVKEITPETVWDTPIPLHPGAQRYYEEIGAI